MHATDVGEGPVTLFVHGVGTSSYLWRKVIAELRDERRCVAVDLPGHGASDPQDDMSLPALADTLEEFCAGLNEKVDLVANDSGGAIAQLFAVKYPARLRTLTLTNCDVHENTPPEAFRGTVELAQQGQLVPLTRSLLDQPEVLAETAFGPGYENLNPQELVDHYLRPIFKSEESALAFERMVAGINAKDMLDIEERLTVLAVPTLVVWGTDDVFFGLEWARWLRDTIPGVKEVVEIEGGRLFFPDERASELVPHLRRHFASYA